MILSDNTLQTSLWLGLRIGIGERHCSDSIHNPRDTYCLEGLGIVFGLGSRPSRPTATSSLSPPSRGNAISTGGASLFFEIHWTLLIKAEVGALETVPCDKRVNDWVCLRTREGGRLCCHDTWQCENWGRLLGPILQNWLPIFCMNDTGGRSLNFLRSYSYRTGGYFTLANIQWHVRNQI